MPRLLRAGVEHVGRRAAGERLRHLLVQVLGGDDLDRRPGRLGVPGGGLLEGCRLGLARRAEQHRQPVAATTAATGASRLRVAAAERVGSRRLGGAGVGTSGIVIVVVTACGDDECGNGEAGDRPPAASGWCRQRCHGGVPLLGGSVLRVAAPSDHERWFEQDLLVGGVGVGELLDEEANDLFAGDVEGLANAGERHGRQAGGGGVVEPGDGDVAAGARPASRAAASHPKASTSLTHTMAVGASGRASRSRAIRRPPPVTSSLRSTRGDVEPQRAALSRRSLGSGRHRRRSPSGQPTNARRRWPSDARCRTAVAIPAAPSTSTHEPISGSAKRRPKAANGILR